MEEIVARLQWEGQDVEKGTTETGLALIPLVELVITRLERTKGDLLFAGRMQEFGRDLPGSDEIDGMREEAFVDPSSVEVAQSFYLKAVQLSPNYCLGYVEIPSDDRPQGFAFQSGVGPIQPEPSARTTFS